MTSIRVMYGAALGIAVGSPLALPTLLIPAGIGIALIALIAAACMADTRTQATGVGSMWFALLLADLRATFRRSATERPAAHKPRHGREHDPIRDAEAYDRYNSRATSAAYADTGVWNLAELREPVGAGR